VMAAAGPPCAGEEAAAAVAAILRAEDHYAAINAPRSADAAELRRRYLAASVRVHPDKNPHPEATRAFQRVTAAWSVLSDPERRRRYDSELELGFDGDDQDLTPDEAFAVFAMAAAMATSSSDLAETLFWAQQVGSLQRGRPQTGVVNAPPAAAELRAAAGAMVGSGALWAAGLAASCVGLPRIGGLVRRVAVIQGVSQLVLTLQHPEVREALHSGGVAAAGRAQELSSKLSHLGLAFCDSAGQLACYQRGGGPAPRPGLRPGFLLSGAGHRRAKAASSGARGPACGAWVRLDGLAVARHLDGRLGEVLGYDAATQRYKIRLAPPARAGADDEGTVKLLKAENLLPAVSRSILPPAAARDFL